MKRSTKIILGVLSFSPLVYIVFFIAFMISMVSGIEDQHAGDGPPAFFMVIFPIHALMMFVQLGLLIYYMVDVFRRDDLNSNWKAAWAVILLSEI